MLNQKEMFIAVYRFTVISGKEATFEAAWLKRTQGIYLRLGSLGFRLHRQANGDYIAYAQWPSRETWLNADSEHLDEHYMRAQMTYSAVCSAMKRCLNGTWLRTICRSEPLNNAGKPVQPLKPANSAAPG